jgi:hypothetical protein
MRSSPNSSVVSRRGSEDQPGDVIRTPEGVRERFLEGPLKSQVDTKDEGLTVYLKVNYKVVLLITVLFDFFHTSLNEVVAHVFGI